jgi:uncharacterized protein YjeT (DUF2065 family)
MTEHAYNDPDPRAMQRYQSAPPRHVPVNGKAIRFHWGQMVTWKVIAGFAGACFVAGLYFLLLQVNWHVSIDGVKFQVFNLKPWWDGLFSSRSWVLYRHGLRDLGEPAAATMGVMTLIASPKTWGTRLGTRRLVTAPLVLAAVAVVLIIGGVWLLDFGLPQAWHALFGAYRVTAPAWIAHSSWQNLLLGFLIGRVLHPLWAPVGATLQGYRVDAAVDRALVTGRTPLWVGLPVVPPVIRERFSWDLAGRELTAGEKLGGVMHPSQLHEQPDRSTRALIIALIIIGVLFTVAGALAKFWIATGHGFPYLAP